MVIPFNQVQATQGIPMSTTNHSILAVVTGVETSAHVLEPAVDRVEQESASLVATRDAEGRVRHQSTLDAGESRPLPRQVHVHKRPSDRGGRECCSPSRPNSHWEPKHPRHCGQTGWRTRFDCHCSRSGPRLSEIFLPTSTSWIDRVFERTNRRIANRVDGTVAQASQPSPANLKTMQAPPAE